MELERLGITEDEYLLLGRAFLCVNRLHHFRDRPTQFDFLAYANQVQNLHAKRFVRTSFYEERKVIFSLTAAGVKIGREASTVVALIGDRDGKFDFTTYAEVPNEA